ncbi:MAG: hypothetical protein ISR59_13340 [Anaerolineales bacterium]|uniref:Uncharacterized protein n=1 Tax=Candidatus Desulfolinea nitratireducens TaxID=2841698 RepID=A0A8J6NFP0_9CHLR|nr:hypothetical protein [Candidatus Desulfolinea nitratireducens]MBL6962085.1 hypothetical protein [Anaerolineales bacterium]
MSDVKPLNWKHEPGIGYHVVRRNDGGMHYTFTDLSKATVVHWKKFAEEHLFDADRLTRNLYDLRQVEDVPEEALRAAIRLNSDPSARKIRLAVVVANEEAANAIRKVAALADTNFAADIHIYTDLEEAESWLSKPLDQFA